jgi:formamidopyrimidine-DNA glycosylase
MPKIHESRRDAGSAELNSAARPDDSNAPDLPTSCRLQIGDTADCKSALRQRGRRLTGYAQLELRFGKEARMPELPDITIYIDALESRVLGKNLQQIRIASPFLLRTAVPPIQSVHGRTVKSLQRLGKRIAIGLEGDLWFVLHLMIAGRLHWREPRANLSGKNNLAAFDFSAGTLLLTEAGTKKRASLHLIASREALNAHNPGGLEILGASLAAFAETLTRRNHTLKRALTDPRLFSGIGNAYSDEILHRAHLSPVTLTHKLSPEQIRQLHQATRDTLTHWINALRKETGDGFPEHVTAFRKGMAVHGRFGKPCPDCGTPIQRIRYASNETNYCPHCQTGGKLLADRSLSLLLKKDWPATLEELEELRRSSAENR